MVIILAYTQGNRIMIISPTVTFKATKLGPLSLRNGKLELVLTLQVYDPESSLPKELTIAVLV